MVEVLVSCKKVDIDEKCLDGRSALWYAFRTNQWPIVAKCLLDAKACISSVRTPFSIYRLAGITCYLNCLVKVRYRSTNWVV